MGNSVKTGEKQPLLGRKDFVLYCDQENIKKVIETTNDGLRFPMGDTILVIPYATIQEVKCLKVWPWSCYEDLMYFRASGKLYFFSGKSSSEFTKFIEEKIPDIEILL